jgi:hypothetical protein
MNADDLIDFWNAHTARWLAGDDPMTPQLARWWSSYQGTGAGKPTRECFAEPWIGPYTRDAPLVTLGLNPGQAFPQLQSRTGRFADEIRAAGSYFAWAQPNPYLEATWTGSMGRPNTFHERRREFARRWLGKPVGSPLAIELFPWHSTKVTGVMAPPGEILQHFVWEPLADLGHERLFASGKPWAHSLDAMHDIRMLREWKAGDSDYPSRVASRRVRVYELPTGAHAVVCWYAGQAGPFSAAETELLREILDAGPLPNLKAHHLLSPTADLPSPRAATA